SLVVSPAASSWDRPPRPRRDRHFANRGRATSRQIFARPQTHHPGKSRRSRLRKRQPATLVYVGRPLPPLPPPDGQTRPHPNQDQLKLWPASVNSPNDASSATIRLRSPVDTHGRGIPQRSDQESNHRETQALRYADSAHRAGTAPVREPTNDASSPERGDCYLGTDSQGFVRADSSAVAERTRRDSSKTPDTASK